MARDPDPSSATIRLTATQLRDVRSTAGFTMGEQKTLDRLLKRAEAIQSRTDREWFVDQLSPIVVGASRKAVAQLVYLGYYFARFRARFEYGQWQLLFQDEGGRRTFPFKYDYVAALMRLVEVPQFADRRYFAQLPPHIRTLDKLGRLQRQGVIDLTAMLNDHTIRPTMQERDVDALRASRTGRPRRGRVSSPGGSAQLGRTPSEANLRAELREWIARARDHHAVAAIARMLRAEATALEAHDDDEEDGG